MPWQVSVVSQGCIGQFSADAALTSPSDQRELLLVSFVPLKAFEECAVHQAINVDWTKTEVPSFCRTKSVWRICTKKRYDYVPLSHTIRTNAVGPMLGSEQFASTTVHSNELSIPFPVSNIYVAYTFDLVHCVHRHLDVMF